MITNFCRAWLVLLGTVALAGAQPAESGKGSEAQRVEGSPGGRTAGKERPPGDPRGERGRPERRGLRPPVEGFMQSYDQDGDKAVSFDEFRVGKKMQNMSDEGKKRIFDHLDKNGDGKISREELPGEGGPDRNGGERFGDKNGDGKISLEEFLNGDRSEVRKEMFRRMDSNADGFLTPEDFRNRPEGSRPWDRRRPLPDPQALEKFDLDKDGALTFDEWRQNPRFKEIPEERLKEWFGRLDRNDDGKLDPADRPEGRGPEGRPPGGRGPESGPRQGPEPGSGPGPGQRPRPDGEPSGSERPKRPAA